MSEDNVPLAWNAAQASTAVFGLTKMDFNGSYSLYQSRQLFNLFEIGIVIMMGILSCMCC